MNAGIGYRPFFEATYEPAPILSLWEGAEDLRM